MSHLYNEVVQLVTPHSPDDLRQGKRGLDCAAAAPAAAAASQAKAVTATGTRYISVSALLVLLLWRIPRPAVGIARSVPLIPSVLVPHAIPLAPSLAVPQDVVALVSVMLLGDKYALVRLSTILVKVLLALDQDQEGQQCRNPHVASLIVGRRLTEEENSWRACVIFFFSFV